MTIKNDNFDKYNPAKIYGNWVFNDTVNIKKNMSLKLERESMQLGTMKLMLLNMYLCKRNWL